MLVNVGFDFIELIDPENKGFAVGISSLSIIQREEIKSFEPLRKYRRNSRGRVIFSSPSVIGIRCQKIVAGARVERLRN